MAGWKPKGAVPEEEWRPPGAVPEDDARQDFGDAGATAREPGPESVAHEPYGPVLDPVHADLRPSVAGDIRDVAEAAGVPIPTEEEVRGALASFLQGPGFNAADEIMGLHVKQDVAIQNMFRPADEQVDPEVAYTDARNELRATEEAFRREYPGKALGLTVAGGLLAPVPGAGAKHLAARVAGAAVGGGIAGAGASEEADGMGMGAAIGAPLGATGQLLGEGAGALFRKFLGWVGGKAGAHVTAANAKVAEMEAKDYAKEVAKTSGALGAEVQKGNRAIENAMRLSGNVGAEEQALLAALEETGAGQALRNRLARSVAEEMPGKIAAIDAAEAELKAVLGRTPAEREAARQAILSGGEAKRQFMERFKRYFPTLVGAVMGADKKGAVGGALAGYALGGTPGSALIGGLAMGGLRPALRAGERMLAHPSVQRAMYSPVVSATRAAAPLGSTFAPLLGSATRADLGHAAPSTGAFVDGLATTNPEALGPYAEVLQRAAAEGSTALVHWQLQQTDPQYRALIEALRKEQLQ